MRHLPPVRLGLTWLMLAVASTASGARSETWLRVSTAELTVITPLGAKEATAFAGEFAQYVAALRNYFGAGGRRLPALTIVAFARDRDFERYLPLLAPGGKPQKLDGFFSRQESWAVAGVKARMSDETRRTVFHEGVHWFLSTTSTRNAVWLEEGLAEVFSTFRVNKDRAEWGRAIEEHVRTLGAGFRLPLEKVLYTAHGELFGSDEIRTGIVYAESWAFVHYLIFGKHDLPRAAIANYTDAISKGDHPDAAFRSAFGRTYAEMDRLLDAYLSGGTYFVAQQPLAATAVPDVQPATPVEVENALGRLAYVGHRRDQAAAHARAAIAAAPEDPRGHELCALVLKAGDDMAGAQVEFEAAIARGSRDFQPHFEVAVAAHNALLAEQGEFKPEVAREIANRYERAINFYPRFRASYENLASVMGVAEPVRSQDREFLEFGLRLFPESGMIQLGLAQLSRRNGDPATARSLLDKVLKSRAGHSLECVQYAHRLDAGWDREDIGRRVDELAKAGKFAEAIAFLDDTLSGGVDGAVRMALAPVRAQLELGRLSQEIKAALDDRRWIEARRLLAKFLASSAPADAKARARLTLADLDRQKLGLTPVTQ